MAQPHEVVSFDDEPLICVDEDDRVLGYETKVACHAGEGILHRAFSIFIFNGLGELLIHRRSDQKPLWPGYWTNSCCSHPRRGENLESAATRRLKEELGMQTPLSMLFKFIYFAPFGEAGSERELCAVFVGVTDEAPQVNDNEIAEWKYVSVAQLEQDIETTPNDFTPWFKLEWPRIRAEHWNEVRAALSRVRA